MTLKRNIFHECKGLPRKQKAVSIALYLKILSGRTSTIHRWTYNKLHKLTRISPTTLRKYMPVMKDMGLVHFSGRNDEHLVVSRLSSGSRGRNIDISQFDFTSFKDIYNCLRAFLAVAIQARKDFIRRAIHASHNASSFKEFKSARLKLKRLVKSGAISGMDAVYEEYGLSRARIARETGNCLRTAHKIIGFAAKKQWWRKENHQTRVLMSGICFRDTGEFFTYATKNYLVISHANTYILSESVYKSVYPLGNT